MKHDYFHVQNILSSVSASLTDSSGIGYSGSNPVPVTITAGASATSASNIVDSTGVAYTGSNPVPVVITSGAGATQAVVIVDSTGVAYNGDNPMDVDGTVVVSSITASTATNIVDSTGVAYTTSNPVPVTLATKLDSTNDSVLSRPVSLRGGLLTAYVTEDEVEEVTLLAGVASEYHDLVYVMGANESDAAINLDIRCTDGGNVQMSLEVPANGTAGVALPVPMPQSDVDATWTVQNSAADNSNTVYSVTALFSNES